MSDRAPLTPASSARSPGSVRLLPLRPERLEEYLRPLVEGYAQDHVQDGQWTEAESLTRARAEVASLLPRGVETPGHYLRSVVAESDGADVGRVWFATRKEGLGPLYLFIYDLLIFEAYRGRGYGEATLRALEPVARELGAPRIALHVFGHNGSAIRLYERVGYRATNVLMSKSLNGP